MIKDANRYIEEGKYPVTWVFSTIPSDAWKDGVGGALTAYAEGTGGWDALISAFVRGWEIEYNKTH